MIRFIFTRKPWRSAPTMTPLWSPPLGTPIPGRPFPPVSQDRYVPPAERGGSNDVPLSSLDCERHCGLAIFLSMPWIIRSGGSQPCRDAQPGAL